MPCVPKTGLRTQPTGLFVPTSGTHAAWNSRGGDADSQRRGISHARSRRRALAHVIDRPRARRAGGQNRPGWCIHWAQGLLAIHDNGATAQPLGGPMALQSSVRRWLPGPHRRTDLSRARCRSRGAREAGNFHLRRVRKAVRPRKYHEPLIALSPASASMSSSGVGPAGGHQPGAATSKPANSKPGATVQPTSVQAPRLRACCQWNAGTSACGRCPASKPDHDVAVSCVSCAIPAAAISR